MLYKCEPVRDSVRTVQQWFSERWAPENTIGLLKRTNFRLRRGWLAFDRSVFSEKGRVVLKSVKAMGVYGVVALLISVFWFVGCGGSTQDWNRSSNQTTVRLAPVVNRTTAKLRDVADSPKETVQRFAIDEAKGALTAAASRLGWCCPAASARRGRTAGASCESCEWKMEMAKCEMVLVWHSLHPDASRKEETCRLDLL